jgi:hypothetical protein
VSRRSLLSKAGAAAVAAVAAGTLLNARQARADHYDPGIWVDFVHAHSTNGYAVYAESTDGIGVEALAPNGTGVVGQSGDPGYYGVHGQHIFTSGHGVVGDGKGAAGVGVLGRNSTGVGVQGTGKNGVYGLSDTGDGWGAVVGRSTGQGGIGTYGECSGGTGVKGISTSGYAGEFVGGKAQLKLQPGGSADKPTSGTHSTGEIYVDKAGTLFVCVASSTSTTAAKWMKVSTTAV